MLANDFFSPQTIPTVMNSICDLKAKCNYYSWIVPLICYIRYVAFPKIG